MEQPPVQKKTGLIKPLGIGCGGLLAIIIIIGVLFGPSKEEQAERKRLDDSLAALQPKQPAPVSRSLSETLPKQRRSGTGVRRKAVISVFEKKEIGFRFEKGRALKEQENYVGTATAIPGAMIQLLGPADNLISAASITMLSTNRDANVVAAMVPVGLAKVFDGRAAEWVTARLTKADYRKDFSAKRKFGDIHYEITYGMRDGYALLTLSIGTE